MDAQLVGDNIARQLEKRVSYKKAIKKSISTALRMGAEGIKIQISGRLNGAEIARREMFKEGRIPLAYPSRRYRLCHRDGRDHIRYHRHQGMDLQRRIINACEKQRRNR